MRPGRPAGGRTEQSEARTSREARLRPEIQALRALAVAAVLVYHLVPSRFPGGYVGVDIFFVISGFLITGHLARELDSTGTVRLARFWARRAKRLLPSALLVLAVSTLAVLAIVPRVLWSSFLGEILSATFYVENWRLVLASVDYFGNGTPSPVQHFWSLSVEEQFYLVLPLVVLLAALLARRAGAPVRRVLAGTLGTLALASLALCLVQTANEPALAYLSSATRAWELLAGGLLALVPAHLAGGPRARALAAVLGCALLAISLASFDESTPFPGSAALLPVLGTLAVIWAGELPGRLSVGRLGSWWPVATLGRCSYAVYLWHWPLVVLVPLATGSRLGLVGLAAVLVLTLVLALASTAWIEDPVRFSPRLLGGDRSPRTVFAWSLAGMLVVGALSAAALGVAREALDEARHELLALRSEPRVCGGAVSLTGDPACPSDAHALVPHPALAPEDRASRLDCWASNTEHELRLCSLGTGEESADAPRVLVLGDSHAFMLSPAFEQLATERGWRVELAAHANCTWTRAQTPGRSRSFAAACADWREALEERLAASEPYDAILVVGARTAELASGEDRAARELATATGYREAWAAQLARGSAVIALSDVPQPDRDVVECVVRHGAEPRCSTPRAEAEQPPDLLARSAEELGLPVIDLAELVCEEDSCPAVLGGIVVWQDRGHLTASFARTLGPVLGDRLAEGIGEG